MSTMCSVVAVHEQCRLTTGQRPVLKERRKPMLTIGAHCTPLHCTTTLQQCTTTCPLVFSTCCNTTIYNVTINNVTISQCYNVTTMVCALLQNAMQGLTRRSRFSDGRSLKYEHARMESKCISILVSFQLLTFGI